MELKEEPRPPKMSTALEPAGFTAEGAVGEYGPPRGKRDFTDALRLSAWRWEILGGPAGANASTRVL